MKFDVKIKTRGTGISGVSLNGRKLKLIGRSCRVVFGNSKYVVKVSPPTTHLYQSQNEVGFWNRIKKQDKKYFAPLLGYGASFNKDGYICIYVIQKRIHFKPLKHNKAVPPEMLEKITELNERYDLGDVWANDCKYKNGNWVIDNKGNMVILDYGV